MSLTPAPDAQYAHPLLAACYDAIDGSREDLDLYEAIVAELCAHRIVDLGCGTGSLALRLAAAGLEVIGVDPAAASLEVARAKERALPAGGRPVRRPVRWVHADATALGRLDADLAVMTGNVAQVFTSDAAWAATLRGALRRGGHLVFEARRPEARAWEGWDAAARSGAVREVEVPGIGMVRTRPHPLVIAPPFVTFSDEYAFPDGTVLTSASTLRFRDLVELRTSVEAAGFEVIDVREAPDRPGLEHVLIARAV